MTMRKAFGPGLRAGAVAALLALGGCAGYAASPGYAAGYGADYYGYPAGDYGYPYGGTVLGGVFFAGRHDHDRHVGNGWGRGWHDGVGGWHGGFAGVRGGTMHASAGGHFGGGIGHFGGGHFGGGGFGGGGHR
jgi:hypothetical protein